MKIESISNNTCKGLLINNLLPKEAVGVLEKLRQHGSGYFMDFFVRSRIHVFQLSQLKPRDFFSLASDHPLTFFELLQVASDLGDKIIKGWMLSLHEGVIREEASFSNCGITLNGKYKSTRNITEAISLVGKYAGEGLRRQRYFVGRHANLLLFDAPQIAGITSYKSKSDNGTNMGSEHILHQVRGAISAEKLINVSLDLFQARHFAELQLIQPVMPPMVTSVSFFKSQEKDDMLVEMRFDDSSQEILNNIQSWL